MQLIQKLSICFVNVWTANIIDVGFINLVHIFPYGSEDFIWRSTLVWDNLDVVIFR